MTRGSNSAPRRLFRLELPGHTPRERRRPQPAASEEPAGAGPSYICALDLGSTHAKAAVCQMQGERVAILGQGIQPYLGEPRSADLLAEACERALAQAEEMTEAGNSRKVVADRVVVGVSAAGAFAGSKAVRYDRRTPQEPLGEAELSRILSSAQREALHGLSARARDLGPAMLLVSCSAAQIALDGQRVEDPVGLRGRSVGVRVFNALMPVAGVAAIERLADQLKLDPPEIVLSAPAVVDAWRETVGAEGVGIDIGGRHTSLSLWRGGALVASASVPQGGRDMTVALARAFQVEESRAETLKVGYTRGQFDAGQRQSIQEVLRPSLARWFEAVSQTLRDLAGDEPLPPDVWVWGGGAALPDSYEAARALARFAGLEYAGYPTVRLLSDPASSRLVDRSGFSMGLLGLNVLALPFGALAARQALLDRRLRETTLSACQAEKISYWIPMDA